MIEPQNSMMPLPAEPRPADAPQGDSTAFGEMLAQSLGVVAQVDSNLVQQINPDEGGQGQAQENEQQSAPFETMVARRVDAAESAPIGDSAPVVPTIGLGDDNRGAPKATPPFGLVAAEATPKSDGDRPVHSLPTPPTPVATPDQAEPIDTIWKPSLTGNDSPDLVGTQPVPVGAELPIEPGIGGPALDRAPEQPVVGPEANPAAPAEPPSSSLDPTPVAGTEPGDRVPLPDPAPVNPVRPDPLDTIGAGREPRFVAAPVTPRSGAKATPPVKPGSGRSLPPVPSPTDNPGSTPNETIAATAPDPIARPDLTSRVNLSQDSPVRFGSDQPIALTPPATGMTESIPVSQAEMRNAAPDPIAPIETHNVLNSSGTESVETRLAAPAANAVAPTPASALAERVLQAVDLQRTQPPPRSMVVEIPEVEGLRLVVSVRAGGQVSVVPAPGWANADAYAPFADDVARVLADRGFVMTGDGRRQSRNPYSAEDAAPPRAARPTFRRPGPTDNDLRI